MAPNPGLWLGSSLPRIVTTQIQCSFGTYFWEMYTFDFGWSPAEYGTVSSIYNFTLFVSYILLGLLMMAADVDDRAGRYVVPALQTLFAVKHATQDEEWKALYNRLGVTCSTVGATCPKGASILPKPSTKPKTITSTFPSTLLDHAPNPLPQFTGCFNTPRMYAWRRFMGTRAFTVYTLVVVHGIAMAGYELCCQALPAVSDNVGNLGSMIQVNMMFFTAANLVVIWYFSYVRYYVHGCARLAKTFLKVSVMYNYIEIPLLFVFILAVMLDKTNNITATPNPKAGDTNIPTTPIVIVVVVLTTFHSTVFFWIFTGGPLTFYVSTNLLDGHEGIKAFGVPAILFGFAGAMVIPGILTLTSADKDNLLKSDQPVLKPTQGTSSGGDSINARRGIIGVTISGQFFTLLVFCPLNYSWNKGRKLNYVILIMTGIVNTLFLSYTYVSFGLLMGRWKNRMIIYGVFYAIMGLNVSYFMGIMFRSFNADEIRRFCRFNYHYCFPTVYKAITIIFWMANALAYFALFVGFRFTGGKTTKRWTPNADTDIDNYLASI